MSFLSKISGLFDGESKASLRQRLFFANKRLGTVVAANVSKSQRWSGTSDDFNQDYLTGYDVTLKKSQDLDVNNGDVRGFHRTRVAQALGRGIRYKHSIRPNEVGLTPEAAAEIMAQVDRLRFLFSKQGGFDSTGKRRSEGKQQERALLTTLVTGCCLIHKVWRNDSGQLLPLAIELIPGSRISTPIDRLGDPLISYGIEYEDEHRTRITGFHVRRVAKTVGNSFVIDFKWDFVRAEDGALLELTEIAGLDRSLPLCVANIQALRNRGQMVEAMIEAARAQANIYAVAECPPGKTPSDGANQDRDQLPTSIDPLGFMNLGSVQMMYVASGEKVNWNTSKLPGPDFKDFMEVMDSRCARGFSAARSRFTRQVGSSFAGGRLEDQMDRLQEVPKETAKNIKKTSLFTNNVRKVQKCNLHEKRGRICHAQKDQQSSIRSIASTERKTAPMFESTIDRSISKARPIHRKVETITAG